MPISQPTFKPGTLNISGASSEKITNLAMATANIEYSHVLQNGVRQIYIRARNNSELKIAFTLGESGTKYITIPRFNSFHVNDLSFSGATLYLQASLNNEVVEIFELF
jgi:hypothetical protein